MKPFPKGRAGAQSSLPHADLQGMTSGARVLTLDGEMPVEFLAPGDRVVTRDTGTATVRAVRRRQVTGDAVGIMAGSLGHTRPDRDVLLPGGQPLFIRDWRAMALAGTSQALIPAARLVDGEFITLHRAVTMTLHDITFDHLHVIYVDGLEQASAPARDHAIAA